MFEIIKIIDYPGTRLHYRNTTVQCESQAFEVSIAKWELLHTLCNQGKLVDDGGIQTCGLCILYFYGHIDECEDCPITSAGHRGCTGTPYKDYVKAVENSDLERAVRAVLEEILFLRACGRRYDSTMPMPTYRNTNCSPLFALLGMALICVMLLAGSRVFKPAMIKLAGSLELREFEKAFREVQHPAGTERLSVQAKMGEFAGGEQGCDFFVGEVRRYDSKKDVIFAFYADHANTSIPLKVVFIENGQIPARRANPYPNL